MPAGVDGDFLSWAAAHVLLTCRFDRSARWLCWDDGAKTSVSLLNWLDLRIPADTWECQSAMRRPMQAANMPQFSGQLLQLQMQPFTGRDRSSFHVQAKLKLQAIGRQGAFVVE